METEIYPYVILARYVSSSYQAKVFASDLEIPNEYGSEIEIESVPFCGFRRAYESAIEIYLVYSDKKAKGIVVLVRDPYDEQVRETRSGDVSFSRGEDSEECVQLARAFEICEESQERELEKP